MTKFEISLTCSILDDVARIQQARKENHFRGKPINETLEAMHQHDLAAARAKLETLSDSISTPGRVAGPEETPAGTWPDSHRGESRVPVGTSLCH
jgi:hypothetical protein